MRRAISRAADLSHADWLFFKQLADRFEEAWRHGERPAIDAYLPAGEPERRLALLELVHMDLEYRLKAGEPARVEQYLERYPLLRDDPTAVLELAAAEHELRQRQEPVLLSEFRQRFPGYGGLPGDRSLPPTVAETPAAASGPPTVIAGYEVLEELGRGGMGVVYKARQKSLNRLVALKMILAGEYASAEQRSRFRREAEAIAQLRHANIVPIHEVGEENGRPFLVLEYVEGGSLAQKLNGKPQPCRMAAALVETLARAAHHAHGQGLIHRDLKPANVLLEGSADAAGWIPRLADFGLVKRLGPDPGSTQSGQVLGTPSYMAPEQASGDQQEIGPACDVYALGAILYELLTGRPPFKGRTALDTLEQVRCRPPIPPRQLQPGLSVDLEAICLKCLAKAPLQRYATAEELADDLQRFLAGQSTRARPGGKRSLRITAILSAVALVVGGLVMALGFRPGSEPTASSPPEQGSLAGSPSPPAPPAADRNGLHAELFQGPSFERKIKTRIDGPLDWIWGLGPPDPDLQPDNCSIRWTGWIKAPRPGRYKLITISDDGVRLWLDGKLRIDHWKQQAVRRFETEVELSGRPHALRIEYLELRSMALMSFRWEQAGGFPEQIVPRAALFVDETQAEQAVVSIPTPSLSTHGLQAALFHGQDLQRCFATRVDATVDWMTYQGQAGPLPPSDVAIRWTGWLRPSRPGRYRLLVISGGGGARLWLDGQRHVDQWHSQELSRFPVLVDLECRPYPLRIEFFKEPTYDEHSLLSFRWQEPGAAQEVVVPTEVLFHDRTAAGVD